MVKASVSMSGVKPQVFVEMASGEQIVLPIDGPSRKHLIAGAVVIGVLSLGVGIFAGAKAFRARTAPTLAVAPPVENTESGVILSEAPYILPLRTAGDGGVARGGQRNGVAGSRSAQGTANIGNSGAGANAANTQGNPSTNTPVQSSGVTSIPVGRNNGGSTAAGTRNTGSGTTVASNTAANANANPANGSNANPEQPLPEIGGGTTPDIGGVRGPHAPVVGGYSEGDTTDATGTMADPGAFTFVYRFHRSQIGACHATVTRNGQSVIGRIRVRMRLGTNGHVTRTTILENTTNNAQLAQCVQDRIRSWAYPAPEGGEVDFEYNLAFGS